MSKPAEILLLSGDPARVHQWARALTSPRTSLWQGPEALLPQTRLDVIVTDREYRNDLAPLQDAAARLAAGEIGLIAVGCGGTADVKLPAECTPGELQVACGLLTEVVRLRRQVNRQRRVQRVLTQLAMSDPLTGLPNRRAWEDRLAAWQLDRQSGAGELSLAVLDLDDFKAINERGHLVGDRVLQHVARQLSAGLGEHGFAARLGGDEFGLLIAGLEPAAAVAAVERLRLAACAGCDPPVTASAGVAAGETGGVEELLQAADQALRRAKAGGRNHTAVTEMSRS